MARPKGSGQGMVVVPCRLPAATFQALEQWRLAHSAAAGEEITQSQAMRLLISTALEDAGIADAASPTERGYQEGLTRGRARWHRGMKELWAKINNEGAE